VGLAEQFGIAFGRPVHQQGDQHRHRKRHRRQLASPAASTAEATIVP
jgi:hypothetical protein